MGQTGSCTSKGDISQYFFAFTTWGPKQMKDLRIRCQKELADTFALRWAEFEFLLNPKQVDFVSMRHLFYNVFDNDSNKLVDKMEVVCAITLCSRLSTKMKIEFFFELFNFNEKGYLTESEVSLLFRTVTVAAYKTDNTMTTPPNRVMLLYLQAVFQFAVYDRKNLRRPELIEFCAENATASLFLDAWRYTSSQVLLRKGYKWQDSLFPPNQTAIYPSADWCNQGLPPNGFLHWKRRDELGLIGSPTLFSHTAHPIKTVDRRLMYDGRGICGQGTLVQGMLADRWILNALAAVIARPFVVCNIFTYTGQEESAGRFCIRLFEGSGYTTVFVDDRLPCTPMGTAAFAASSDMCESWIMLLEKGIAKYLGSYGHIGHFSNFKADSTLMALRWFTGGHVSTLPTCEFGWKSVEGEVGDLEDGACLISKLLKEGSFISLVRSDTLLQVCRTKAMIDAGIFYPPHGRLFPVVGQKLVDGYKTLVLRDAWGLIPTVTCLDAPDFETGHCRVFDIRVEDVSAMFDLMVVSRFPDALRNHTKTNKIKPWKTVVSRVESSNRGPARFVLKVMEKPIEILEVSEDAKKKTKIIDPLEYQRQKDLEEKNSHKVAVADEVKLVDVAITISSSIQWMSTVKGTCVRARIFPSPDTLKQLILRKRDIHVKAKEARRQLRWRRLTMRRARRLEAEAEAAEIAAQKELMASKNKRRHAKQQKQDQVDAAKKRKEDAALAAEVARKKQAAVKIFNPYEGTLSVDTGNIIPLFVKAQRLVKSHRLRLARNFQIEMSAEGSWVSRSLRLLPGEYHVYADIRPLEQRASIEKMRSTPLPTADSSHHHHPYVILQTSSCTEFESAALSRTSHDAVTVAAVPVAPETWTIMSESQTEASSKALTGLVSRMHGEAKVLSTELKSIH